MPSSDTQICNLALGHLGEGRITSLSEDTVAARACSLHYEAARDQVLRSHRWNFAQARVVLSALAEAPAFGWSYQYALPAECLRVLEVNDSEVGDVISDSYIIEGRLILTNADAVRLVYVRRVTDVAAFDALFVEALALKLAINLTETIRGTTGKTADLLAQYEGKTAPLARRVDANEGKRRKGLIALNSFAIRERGGAGCMQSGGGSSGGSGGAGATGPQGPQGVPGADGADGADGAPGTDGADGLSAYQVAVSNGFVGNQAAWLASLVGPQGEPGEDGTGGGSDLDQAGFNALLLTSAGEVSGGTSPIITGTITGSGGTGATVFRAVAGNTDYVDALYQGKDFGGAIVFSVNAAGSIRSEGSISAFGNVTGANLSGSNTGDQDLSGYAVLLSSGTNFSGNLSAGADITAGGNVTGANLSGTNTGDQNLSSLAPKASPTFTGTPAAPTATTGTNTTQLATTAFVRAEVAALVNSAPGALDTLGELAAAITADESAAATLATLVGTKAPSASPTFTGIPAAPTAAAGTNSTQLATTAFVFAERAATLTLTNHTLGSGTVITAATMTLGSDASGDMYYRNSSGALTRLAAPSNGVYEITWTGGVPSFTTASGGGASLSGTNTWTGGNSFTPANANIVLSPTGTGVVTIAPATAGTVNNVAIGGATPLAGAFTTLSASGTLTAANIDASGGVTLKQAGTAAFYAGTGQVYSYSSLEVVTGTHFLGWFGASAGNRLYKTYIQLGSTTSPGTPITDTARIYAKKDGTTTRIYALDEAGVETLLSGKGQLTAVKSAFDCPSIAANGGVQTTTVTVTGATTGSMCNVSLPSTGIDAGVTLQAYVSATNTVTIVFTNCTTSAIDPSAKDYRVTVFNY